MMQSIRVALDNGEFKYTREMYLVIRCLINIVFLMISLFDTKSNHLEIGWYAIISFVMVFNYYVDLKYDWGLLEMKS